MSHFKSIYPKDKYKLTQLQSLDQLPDDTDVVYDVMHQSKYTAGEEATLKKFLNTGFRLILIGENNNWNKVGNGHISGVVARLGGGVRVRKKSSNDNDFQASKK